MADQCDRTISHSSRATTVQLGARASQRWLTFWNTVYTGSYCRSITIVQKRRHGIRSITNRPPCLAASVCVENPVKVKVKVKVKNSLRRMLLRRLTRAKSRAEQVKAVEMTTYLPTCEECRRPPARRQPIVRRRLRRRRRCSDHDVEVVLASPASVRPSVQSGALMKDSSEHPP